MANVNNYVKAGNASVRKAVAARKALADNKVRFDELGIEGIKADRDANILVAKSNSLVSRASLNAASKMAQTEAVIDRDKRIAAAERNVRKAGLLAAGAQALGAASYLSRKKDEPNETLSLLQQQLSKLQGRKSEYDADYEKLKAGLKTGGGTKDTGTTDNVTTDTTKTTAPTSGQSDGWSRWSKLIRAGEGTSGDKGYTTMFTGSQFSDTSKHPRQINRSGDLSSDAAGAYQFLSTTWDGAKNALGLTDFSPASQEKAGKYLAQKRGLAVDTVFTDKQSFLKELDKIAPEWASMPTLATGTSHYGQGGLTPDKAWAIYNGG